MNPLDFLAAVLPSAGSGLYCAAADLGRRSHHKFAETLEELQTAADKWDKGNLDVYFALATYSSPVRKAEHAVDIRALFLDLDGYDTKKAAALALGEFLDACDLSALGQPWLVSSGGGVHAYWPFASSVPVSVWKPTAERLKRLCKQEGLRIDNSVTADAARVLRFPGTRNHKPKYAQPLPVKVLLVGDTFEFEQLNTVITTKLRDDNQPPASTTPISLPGTRPKKAADATQTKLLQNSATEFARIVQRTQDGTGCAQLKNYLDNPQEDGLEPIWRGLLSWAKVCTDGEEQSLALSALHPYPVERMRTKLREIKGPYPCTKMDSENPGLCTGCPHWGKITNPLGFGRVILKDETPRVVPLLAPAVADIEAQIDAQDGEEGDDGEFHVPAASVMRPPAPRGFSYGAKGGVYCEKEDKDAQGKRITREVEVLPYDLFVVDVLKQEADCAVHIVASRPDGVASIVMPQRAIASKDETVRFLASQNIIASYGKGNDENLYNYVRACATVASLRRPVDVPIQCGWQKDGTFVYNYRIFKRDGSELAIPMPGLENINRNTTPTGTLDGWRRLWNVFIKKELHTLLVVAVEGFGSPLMRFTDYDGFVWHLGGQNSGTGKSLALSAKAGIWGHPKRYRTGKDTSPMALQQRAGLLNSLPLLIDEITSPQRADMEWAPAFIFNFAEGQGKERMEAGSNKERINNSTWATTCTMTSNTNLTDYMSGVRAHSSQGELLRMLEWTPTVELSWTPEERRDLNNILTNYGVAGEAWVRWLVANQDTVRDVVRKVHDKLAAQFGFTDQERYWHAGCTVTMAAAVLLGERYANIINLPVQAMRTALQAVVDRARGGFDRSKRTAEDILNAYTRENYGSFIVIKKADGRLLAAWGDGETTDKSLTRSKVMGRVEHDLSGTGVTDYFIEEQMMKRHCVALSFGYDEFKRQLADRFPVKYVRKDMLARTNGPAMRVNALHIIRSSEDHENLVSVGPAEPG